LCAYVLVCIINGDVFVCLFVFTRVEAQLPGAYRTSYGDKDFVARREEIQTPCSVFPSDPAPPLGQT